MTKKTNFELYQKFSNAVRMVDITLFTIGYSEDVHSYFGGYIDLILDIEGRLRIRILENETDTTSN